ncbi:MAG: glycosyltransferase family 39 protein, partial [Nitrospinota bacterium]
MTPPGAGIGAKEWKWALGLAGIALVLRVVSAADYLDDWDSVDFALALRRYSVVEMRPHFPGYPVYIWLASAAQTLVGDVPRALTYTSALAGGLTVWPVLLLARRLLPLRAALLAACLFLFSPLHWLTSAKALSDATGALFVIAFLAAALAARQSPEAAGRRRNEVVSSLCLGLALGARLSYFPFLITWFGLWLFPRERIHLRARLRHLGWSAAALALPVACWTLWQVGQEGAAPLIGEGLRFAGGHMLSWGRSLLTDPQPWLRPLRFLGDLWADGLGMWLPGAGPWRLLPTVLLLAALAGGVWSGGARPRHRGLLSAEAPDRGAPPLDVPFLVLWVAPYGLWLLSGQNPEKPRHLLPFLPLATMGVAALIERAMEGLSPTHPPRRLAAAFGAAATLLVAPVALEA